MWDPETHTNNIQLTFLQKCTIIPIEGGYFQQIILDKLDKKNESQTKLLASYKSTFTRIVEWKKKCKTIKFLGKKENHGIIAR